MTCIDINRVNIALHGVSAQVVETAVGGLEAAVKRRLGQLPGWSGTSLDIGDLSLGPVHKETVLDAAVLRDIIADRLVGAIRSCLNDSKRTSGTGEAG